MVWDFVFGFIASFYEFLKDDPLLIIIILISFVCLYLIYIIITDEDKCSYYRAVVWKGVYEVTRRTDAEKKYIENDVNSAINLARRNMPFGKEHIPKSLKIRWFDGDNDQQFQVTENSLFVRLDPANYQNKNIVILANVLVLNTALVGIRHALDKPLEKSIDLNLVKNLLKEIKKPQILDWFLENEYQPIVLSSNEIQTWNDRIVEIDERGLFTRILLVELDAYSKRIAGKRITPEMKRELTDFIEFVYTISQKKGKEDVPLDFESRFIRTGIIILAHLGYIFSSGTEPYVRRFGKKMKERFHSIYVLQYDKEFLGSYGYAENKFHDLADQVREDIEVKFPIVKDFEQTFVFHDKDGILRNGVVTRYHPVEQ